MKGDRDIIFRFSVSSKTIFNETETELPVLAEVAYLAILNFVVEKGDYFLINT